MRDGVSPSFDLPPVATQLGHTAKSLRSDVMGWIAANPVETFVVANQRKNARMNDASGAAVDAQRRLN